MTPLQQHCRRWEQGCGNDICGRRKSLCLGKGQVPCGVLLVGEAPGESEDAIGQPFVGPAGQELDRWIKNALFNRRYGTPPKPELRIAFTNLLACLPREANGRKSDGPLPEEVRQCSQRLREFIMIADGIDPNEEWDEENEQDGTLQLIVTVGSHARDYLDVKLHSGVRLHRPIHKIHVLHPAFVVRQTTAQRQILAQRQTVILKTALEEL